MAKKIAGTGLLQRLVEEYYHLTFAQPLQVDQVWAFHEPAPKNVSEKFRDELAGELRRILKSAGVKEALFDPFDDLEQDLTTMPAAVNNTDENLYIGPKFQAPHEASAWLKLYEWQSHLAKFQGNSLEWLGMHWLMHFAGLQRSRRQIAAGANDPSALYHLVEHAEELGRLQERIWWRTTPVPGTETKASPKGTPPEQLALARLPSIQPFAKRNEGRDQLNAERRATAKAWRTEAQVIADAIWQDYPRLSASAVASRIRTELARRWRSQDSQASIKGATEIEQRALPRADTIRRILKKPVRT